MGKISLDTTHQQSAPGAWQAIAPSSEGSDRLFSCSDAEPLTADERREMNDRLKRFPVSMVRDMQAGIECLPKGTRDRALYNWVNRTKVPVWYRPEVSE